MTESHVQPAPDPATRQPDPEFQGAVILRRTYSPDRKEATVDVECVGDVGLLEVSDIIRMAAARWSAQLGFSNRAGP